MLSSKRLSRQLAMQMLFLWDANGAADALIARQVAMDAQADPASQQRALELAQGAWDGRESIDQWVERLAPQWPPRRQPGVDRALIRMAVWELTSTETPPKVVLDEAIELAKEFSTEQSPAFVNGVLDAVLREHTALTAARAGGEVAAEIPSSPITVPAPVDDPAAAVSTESIHHNGQ